MTIMMEKLDNTRKTCSRFNRSIFYQILNLLIISQHLKNWKWEINKNGGCFCLTR